MPHPHSGRLAPSPIAYFGSPCSRVRHRRPGLLGRHCVALLQKFDRNEIGRAHERHVTVAWRCSILKSRRWNEGPRRGSLLKVERTLAMSCNCSCSGTGFVSKSLMLRVQI